MASLKQFKRIEKGTAQQLRVIDDLNGIVKDIERSEHTITVLQNELVEINKRHANRTTTRDDIAYLEDLLKCANKKLVWEKNIASLQKRTPLVLESVTRLMNDPQLPPNDELRANMLKSLQAVQTAMERLQAAKIV
jgi:hypothetical protein